MPVIARMMLRIPAKLPHNNQEARSEPDHGSIVEIECAGTVHGDDCEAK